MKILIVEDDPVQVYGRSHLLSLAGHSVSTATNGFEAITQLQAAKESGQLFDAITLDLVLPIKGGIPLLKEIRQIPGYEDTPIVITSGLSEDQLETVKVRMPRVTILQKPFDPEQLNDVLSRLE